jgi:hypothetical protein
MDSVVDEFFEQIHANMELELSEWLVNGIDPVNRRYIHVTKTIPDTFRGVVERTINHCDTFDGLCKDEIETIKTIFHIGVPIGILLCAEDLTFMPEPDEELEMCDEVANRVVDACMARVRSGSIHEEMRQKILKQDHAVRVIQRTWRQVIACPENQVCQNRLMRELAEMEVD